MIHLPNKIIDVTKKLLLDNFNSFNHILLDEHYIIDNNNLLLLTVLTESKPTILMDRLKSGDNIIIVKYIPKSSLYNLNEHLDYLKKTIPFSIILKDKDSFLINLKSSFIYLDEKEKIEIDNSKIETLRWEITDLIDNLYIKDSVYTRYKIIEKLAQIYNHTTQRYINLNILPLVLDSSIIEPENFPKELINLKNCPLKDLKINVENILVPFGGILHTLNTENKNIKNGLTIRINTKDCDLDSFLDNFYIKFSSLISRYSSSIENFYWERTSANFYNLTLKLPEKLNLNDSLISEIQLKFENNLQISLLKSRKVSVYDFLNEFYLKSLHKISEYLIEIKYNENELLNEELSTSYAIEYFISCFIEMGFTREDFFNFNKYLSQKWHVLFIPDEELLTNYYTTSNKLYQNFEELYQINKIDINSNFEQKLNEWTNINEAFSEEIETLLSCMNIALDNKDYSSLFRIINTSDKEANKNKFAFLEGFFYKFFGLMGLNLEKKLYITYIINQLDNEY